MERLTNNRFRRRGMAAAVAMLYLVLMTTLVAAMLTVSATNSTTSYNLGGAEQSRANAESGLRWMAYRFVHMNRPTTPIGNITPAVATSLWPSITDAIKNDMSALLTASERPVTITQTSVTCSPIALNDGGGSFMIRVIRHPLDAFDPLDGRYVRVYSTGQQGGARRTVCMDFKIDKKVRFAVVGKVPIQLGRNTLVEGPIAMSTPLSGSSSTPPILSLSDFGALTANLTTRVNAFQGLLKAQYSGYDNRISVNATDAYQAAIASGFHDANGDGYIDEYDLFLDEFDTDGGHAITTTEFTNSSTGQLWDPNLFAAIDNLGGPLFNGDTIRAGYQDDLVSDYDGYAKIRGQVLIAETSDELLARLANAGKTIQDVIQGPIIPSNPGDPALKFGATLSDMIDLNPANFEQCAQNLADQSGTGGGFTSRQAGVIQNAVLTASDTQYGVVTVQINSPGSTPFTAGQVVSQADFNAANAALPPAQRATANSGTNAAVEKSPYGSTSYQATYKRPVFRNIAFKNVQIPKGLNALFDNCTFEGVTFVDTEHDITKSGQVTYDKSDGMTWAQTKVSGDSFSKDKVLISSGTPTSGQTITKGSQQGNNLRFNNCTFNGPIAGNYATAYTHFANSWEFTGATMFDNKWIDPSSGTTTATIVSPQVNIEMGSFTDPSQAPSTLVGVVVAGNLDVRGTGIVDGSIIITGDGAGNTTLGYFGASDSDTNPGAMPEGGFGRLNLRYNPFRALPDGINIPIDILPDPTTFQETVQ